MRTGGAGLSQSSESLHSAAKTGPAVSIGARGCSMTRGGLPSGIEICDPRRTAARISANIARAVDIDHAAGGRSGSVGRKPADRLGYLVGRGNAAERDVGDDLSAPAALQIFLGHFRHGEAGGDAEA